MKKRYMAATVAMVIGMSLGPAGTAVTAVQTGGESGEDILTGGEGILSGQIPDAMVSGNLWPERMYGEKDAMLSLQIPQKMEVIIDPWELDGKGQIYSEKYMIQNTGSATGTLILSFVCRTQENSGVTFRQEKKGLHDDEKKNVYMELVLGDENKIILSQEESEYKVELKAGEELSVSFTGEVNENVSEQWKDGSIVIEGSYLWDAEEELLMKTDETVDKDNFLNSTTEEERKEATASGNDVPENYPAEEKFILNHERGMRFFSTEPEMTAKLQGVVLEGDGRNK